MITYEAEKVTEAHAEWVFFEPCREMGRCELSFDNVQHVCHAIKAPTELRRIDRGESDITGGKQSEMS